MTRIGGISQNPDGSWYYTIPVGNTYRCKKCNKIWTEHIWVGHGWRHHIERMHRKRDLDFKLKVFRDCSCSNCEINHENECDGELEIIKEGFDIKQNGFHKNEQFRYKKMKKKEFKREPYDKLRLLWK